jgi:hypothetical protein
MIHLLPHTDEHGPIECNIFDYDLSKGSSSGHIYEALSYCWGSNARSELMILNGESALVTRNLHTALLHLRDRQLQRTLWVDALCINQDDTDEKNRQIPLMRTIYAQATHVVVWLGEGWEDGDKALVGIQCLAKGAGSSHVNYEAYRDASLRLLGREWFRRIWVRYIPVSTYATNHPIQVLQEIGVARSIYVMCGGVRVSGHIFCEGLSGLRIPQNLQNKVGPVTYLMKGALFRPKYEIDSRGTLSLGRLIGMYLKHHATQHHDRIYALLGLSSDVNLADLQPNYETPWHELLKEATSHIFPGSSVQTWEGTESAIIKCKGWILGHVNFATEETSEYGWQKIKFFLNDTAQLWGYQKKWKSEWVIEACAELIREGDIICLLQEKSEPSIIRLSNDHLNVVTPTVELQAWDQTKVSRSRIPAGRNMDGLRDILLIFRIPLVEAEVGSRVPLELSKMTPKYRELHLETERRLNQIASIVASVAAAQKRNPKSKALDNMLAQSGTCIPIIELFKIAAKSSGSYGTELMEVLFQQRGDNLPVSEEVVQAAAGNTGSHALSIMELLVQQRGEDLPISEKAVEAAARNTGSQGAPIMELLFQQRDNSLPVSGGVVQAVAGNTGSHALSIMELLFQQRGNSLPVSEEVVKAAAMNTGVDGYQVMKFLFYQRGEDLPISEKVVEAAAGNTGSQGAPIIELLFQQRGNSLPVTEGVVQAVAKNTGLYRYEVMKLLFQQRGQSLPVTEEVVKLAAGNVGYKGGEIMRLLFQQRGDNLPVSSEVVKAAAGNTGLYRHQIMELLFKLRGDSLQVSKEVVSATARDTETRKSNTIK